MSALPGLTFSAPGVPLYAALGASGTQSTNSFANTYLWEGADISANSVEFNLSVASTSQIIMGAEGTLFATLTLDGGVGDLEIATAGAVTIPNALNVSSLSTFLVDTDSISTSKIELDGQILTADANDLLLNGVPVATISSLSSIADWSLDPAISTVQMAGYDLNGARLGNFSSLQSGEVSVEDYNNAGQYPFRLRANSITMLIESGGGGAGALETSSITVSTLTAQNGIFQDISTVTFTALSTVSVVSTISSLVLEGTVGSFSTLNANTISSGAIFVSSINGAEFTSTTINVQVAGVSSLVANSISSVGAVIQEALVSTLQFNPSFSPNLDVNLGLGSLFGQLAGAASGGLSLAVSGAALGTGIAALAQGRQTNNINSNSYELVNGTTQLQISTLGIPFSTVYRFVSSVSETTPGEEYFVSTIHSPGVAIRSLSDPLNTVSAPTSTIQSFGQWVALDANLPIPSSVSTYQQLFTSSLGATSPASRVDVVNNMNMSSGTILTVDKLQGDELQVNAIGAFGLGFVDLFANVDNTGYFFSTSALLVSSINGAAYPPPQTQTNNFSTLNAETFNVSTINFPSVPGGNGISGDDAVTTIQGIALYAGVKVECSTLQSYTGDAIYVDAVLRVPNLSSQNLLTSSINGSVYPPPLQPVVSSFQTASVSSATISSINGGIPFTTANPPNIFDTSSILVSSIGSIGNVSSIAFLPNANAFFTIDSLGRFTEIGRNFNLQAQSSGTLLAELLVDSVGAGGSGVFRLAAGVGNINASTVTFSTNHVRMNTISTNVIGCQEIDFAGLSTVTFSTVTAAGAQGQPAGRLRMGGNDLDLGQQDLYCQQIFLGAGNGTNAQSEIVMYDAGGALRTLQTALQDRTIRIGSTINTTQGGYLLDTGINPPFFSTLNGVSTALMAFFPSTINSSIGAQVISVIPPLVVAGNFLSLSTQNLVANTPLVLFPEVTDFTAGGISLSTSAIVIPSDGIYEFATSIQFSRPAGNGQADFWFRVNGTDVPNSASEIAMPTAGAGQTLGNVVFTKKLVTGDKLQVCVGTSDTGVSATFFQSTIAPFARPAVPSLILACKCLNY